MKKEEKYYLRYDDRYRRMHASGFERWVSSHEENAEVLEDIDRFLEYAGYEPTNTSIIEFGCGEGFVAEHLLSRGYDYLGLDISKSAIEKARKHTKTQGRDFFLVADVLNDLNQIPDASFDIAIDNQCFHMLVTDEHRRKYLNDIRMILKKDGKAFFRECVQEEEFMQEISDFRDWLEKTGNEYDTLYDYPAYKDDKQYTVRIPRVPARFNNEAGYRKELERAGFTVKYFASDGWMCIMYAGV
ncbi:MAG: class I SAM-dependent methyltransferase [Dehalococcoidales bacterium]|nr:MAG: class I SAM-dependent methyltransferase [Dehalococcoidales bacterium]